MSDYYTIPKGDFHKLFNMAHRASRNMAEDAFLGDARARAIKVEGVDIFAVVKTLSGEA